MTPEHRPRRRLTLRSLCLLSGLSTGCLVADPPQYEEPATTPVFLDVAAAVPIAGRVIVRIDGDLTIDFDVPFRSEDNGDRVAFGLLQDFGFPGRTDEVFCRGFVPPGTFDETDRAIRFTAVPKMAKHGCNQLTLLVSHEKNFDLETGCRPDLIRGVGDTAMATWWLNVVAPGEDQSTLVNCPSPSEIEQ
jgi:hypothetical protein